MHLAEKQSLRVSGGFSRWFVSLPFYRFPRQKHPEAVLAVRYNQGFMLNGGAKNPLHPEGAVFLKLNIFSYLFLRSRLILKNRSFLIEHFVFQPLNKCINRLMPVI